MPRFWTFGQHKAAIEHQMGKTSLQHNHAFSYTRLSYRLDTQALYATANKYLLYENL